jgi:hypothetical protein
VGAPAQAVARRCGQLKWRATWCFPRCIGKPHHLTRSSPAGCAAAGEVHALAGSRPRPLHVDGLSDFALSDLEDGIAIPVVDLVWDLASRREIAEWVLDARDRGWVETTRGGVQITPAGRAWLNRDRTVASRAINWLLVSRVAYADPQ